MVKMTSKTPAPFKKIQLWLQATLLAGLAVLVPLGLTVYVLEFVVSAADGLLHFLPDAAKPSGRLAFPGAGLLLAFGVTLVAGVIARNLVGHLLVEAFHAVLGRVPVVSGLYKLFRQIADAFLGTGDEKGFKRVVMVEWPRQGAWTLAFVTGEARGAVGAALAGEEGPWVSLFVPTTPNPTAGFYFCVKESDCRATTLTVEAAFKIIISGGALAD